MPKKSDHDANSREDQSTNPQHDLVHGICEATVTNSSCPPSV